MMAHSPFSRACAKLYAATAPNAEPVAETAGIKWEVMLMRSFVATMLAARSFGYGAALAQAPAPAPAAVPDSCHRRPYGPAITADRAARSLPAAVAEAQKSPNWKLAISLVDPNGDLVYFSKDGPDAGRIDRDREGKARTAATFRRPSQALLYLMRPRRAGLRQLDLDLVASRRWFPPRRGRQDHRRDRLQRRHRRQDAVVVQGGRGYR